MDTEIMVRPIWFSHVQNRNMSTHWGSGSRVGLYWDSGKENGNYYTWVIKGFQESQLAMCRLFTVLFSVLGLNGLFSRLWDPFGYRLYYGT